MNNQDSPTKDLKESDTRLPSFKATELNNASTAEPATAEQLQNFEKQMSSFEKTTVRWAKIAVLMSALAAIFVCAQWYEMHRGGQDTHTLAVAAQTQAEKTSGMADAAQKIQQAADGMVAQENRIADNAQKTLEASNSQSKAALDASIATSRNDQRAWVAEIDVGLDAPEIGKPIKTYVTWHNSGKTFAKQVVAFCHCAFFLEPVPNEKALMDMVGSGILPTASIGVLAPSGQYKTAIKNPALVTEVDKERITGTWYTYIWGEMKYTDIFGRTHKTMFCSSRQGASGDFIQCPFHNDAD